MSSRAGITPAAARARRASATTTLQQVNSGPRPLDFLAGTDCHIYVGQWTSDGEYRQRFTGPGIEALLGGPIPAAADPSQAWAAAVHPDDQARYADANHPAEHHGPMSLEYRLIGYDGVTRWVLDRRWPWQKVPMGPMGPMGPTELDGEVIYDGVVTDVTVLHRTIETLKQKLRTARAANRRLSQARAVAEERARTDELTGLFNRRHFTAELARHLNDPATGNRGTGLLLIDIDFFKRINDDYGHAVGDQLLAAFADRLRSATRTCDLVARWGGEEFVVLLPEVSEADVVRRRAEVIRARVANRPFVINGNPVTIEVSVGAVFAHASMTNPDQFLADADEAMYSAKRAGRNQVGLTVHPDVLKLVEVVAPSDPAAITTGNLPTSTPSLGRDHETECNAL